MLISLLSNKEKLIELANTPLNENCSAVILKKLPEKLRDPGKFLIPCGFSELKCKALVDLGASINLMPLSVWKKLDVFVLVGRFTFPADFVIVDYESDPHVPLILGRPFLRTARALIDVHGEEMIHRDGDERLILNMRHDTSSYSNKLKKESINMIDIHNVSYEDYIKDFGNPTPISKPVTKSSSSPVITSFKESELICEELEAYLASDSFSPGNDDPVNLLLEEFANKPALITFPRGNDDLPFDIESDLREMEYLLNHDPIEEMDSILEDSVNKNSPVDNLVDTISKMFTDKHALDYSSPPLWDDYEEKIKDSKILIDELDPPGSSIFLPSPEYDSVFYEYFSEVNALPSTNNEDKVFNPGIPIQENHFEVTNRATPEKNVKKIAISNASLILEDFNPPLYELPFHKEVPGSEILLSFSSENE
ncbi:reverse transcriptase domain-containing protein [Tanacetum coccineum]